MILKRLFIALALLLLGGSLPPASAQQTSPALAVIPFQEPGGEAVDAFSAADSALAADLQKRGFQAVLATATRHLTVPATAAQICATTHAQAIVLGSTRTEQSLHFKYAFVTNIPHYPTHAELRLSMLSCEGRVLWRTVTTGDVDYYASNVGAAVSDALVRAVAAAVDQIPAGVPSQPLEPAAIAASNTSADFVLLPFSEPQSQDGELDAATTSVQDALKSQNISVALLPSMDRFDAVEDAAAICRSYAAKGILIGTLRSEQTYHVGVKTHSEVTLSLVRCDGHVAWTETASAEHRHFGSNLRAAITAATDDAVKQMLPAVAAHLNGKSGS